jgi:hypothetical protein
VIRGGLAKIAAADNPRYGYWSGCGG